MPTSTSSPCRRRSTATSTTIGKYLSPGDTVIYESTVYPGCTEEDCVPILERESGLTCAFEDENPSPGSTVASTLPNDEPTNRPNDPAHEPNGEQHSTREPANQTTREPFFAGYSPERINPGDKQHRLPSIRKVTSGSTPQAAEFVDALYREIITAGTHKATSIRVAEAAKVIENTQRDVNIALINELAMLFGQMGIDTSAVLDAAGTKWNFLPFRPGLVGGHCIGVDPYYLTHKAQQIGFHPQMILAGRRINDGMGGYVAGELIKLMARKGVYHPGARVLVLGLTFKENCPDLRNTRVVDVVAALKDYNLQVDIHDPWADADEAKREYGVDLIETPQILLAVAHDEFGNQNPRQFLRAGGVVYDLKHLLDDEVVDRRL